MKSFLKNITTEGFSAITKGFHAFVNWWNPAIDPRIIRIFRFMLGAVVLAALLVWLPHVRDFFASNGYSNRQFVETTTQSGKWSILFFDDSLFTVWTLYALTAIGGVLLILNKIPWLAHLLVYVGYLSFSSRYPLVNYGGSEVLLFLLFLSIFTSFKPTQGTAFRLIQLHMTIVYFVAGLSKAKVITWQNGSEFIDVAQTRFSQAPLPATDFFYFVGGFASTMTLFSDFVMPVLLWPAPTRRFALFMSALFHLGVLVLMNASLFSYIMFTGLSSFLKPKDLDDLEALWKRLIKKPTS